MKSFNENKSVNYLIRPGSARQKRLESLMAYSFDICYQFGEVFLSDNRQACALVLFPEKNKSGLKTIWLNIKFVFKSIGLRNVLKAMIREKSIKESQPNTLLYYLWFIGVEPSDQGKGYGSSLLKEIVLRGKSMNRTICLETSTVKNLPWYKKNGFEVYAEKDFGYKLYFLKMSCK